MPTRVVVSLVMGVALCTVGCASDGPTQPLADETQSVQVATAADGAVTDVWIKLSPNALILGGGGVWMTVHTNVRYYAVICSTVELQGVPQEACFSDDRGNLVVKVKQADIEPLVSPPTAALTLTGESTAIGLFAGSDEIMVKTGGRR